jgi:hypothetical protein
MERAMSLDAVSAPVVLPLACGMTLLVSELAFATRVMRKAIEQASSLLVCLSICVQRAALKTPRPSDARSLSQNPLRAPTRCGLLSP